MKDQFFDAFRYVADEMTPLEAERFESRLADDQDAREAVARAVGLVGRLQSVPCAVVRRPYRSRLGGRVAAACVAAVMVVATMSVLRGPLVPAETVNVVDAWDSAQDATGTDWHVEDTVVAQDVLEANDDIDVEVPGWLWAAVEAKHTDIDPDEWN